MLRVGGQPGVDERLDRPRPAEGASDEVPTPRRLEVADRLGVVRVAQPGLGDLGLDVRVGDVGPFDLGDLR